MGPDDFANTSASLGRGRIRAGRVKIVRVFYKRLLAALRNTLRTWPSTNERDSDSRMWRMSGSENLAVASISSRRSVGLGMSWPLLLGLMGFILPVVMGRGLNDPDIYWHVTAGRWMFEHGHVALHDPFSFTMHGAVWVAHEWAAELVMAGAYWVAGWSGLVFLAAMCYGASLAYLMRFLLARVEPLHALVLTCLAAWMMFPAQSADPQALVWPLTVLWIGKLIDSTERNSAPPWWLLAVMLAWANLHGSFVLGLGIAIAMAVEAVVKAKWSRRDAARRWTLFVVAAVAVACVNPRGYGLLLYPFHLLGMKTALGLIAAWEPPNFLRPQVLDLWLALVLALAFAGRLRLSAIRSALVLGLLYIALEHVRNVALLGLISPLLLAEPLARCWKAQPVSGRDSDVLDRWFRALAQPARMAAVGVACLAMGTVAAVALEARKPRPLALLTPRAAVDALLSHGAPGRIFNDFNFGGYLIFRGIPVFVDARVDMYGNAFSTQAMEAVALAPGTHLQAILDQYKINSILLQPSRPAVKLLDRLPAWKRVYSDKVAVAYIRRRQTAS